MTLRRFSFLDQILTETQHAMEVLLRSQAGSPQSNPADPHPENPTLTPLERKETAALMRINHTGEVCAQALYRGQALFARTPETRAHLHQAALEEQDHLFWCETRLSELNARISYLNLFWYSASFKIGMIASLCGDAFSEGFVVETERQVEKHLTDHLQKIPDSDLKTRAILLKMREDEVHHQNTALSRGAKPLPTFVQGLMKIQSKVMTTLAYWI